MLKNNENSIDYSVKYIIQNGKKDHLLNNKKTSIKKITGKFHTILFTPDSLSCIKLDASKRRELIDDFIPFIHIEGYKVINAYKKVLKIRNRVLKDFLQDKVPLNQTEKLLESIEKIYLKKACLLTLLRYKTLKTLEFLSQEVLSSLYAIPCSFQIKYEMSGKILEEKGSLDKEIYSAMHKRSLQLRQAEFLKGSTLVGPQRHDISFLYNGQNSRFYCSPRGATHTNFST